RSSRPTRRSGFMATRRCEPPISGLCPMLEVDNRHAYYGKSHILRGVTLRVGTCEIVSLLGRNGAGRSTVVKTIMGQVRPVGSVRFQGARIDGLEASQIARTRPGA